MRNLVIASLTIFFSSTALSCADSNGFTRNYGAWKELSKAMKGTYISGAFNMLMNSGSEDPGVIADQHAIQNCAMSAGITPFILMEMVDRRYEQHTEEWVYGPASVMTAALIETCKTQINDERRKSKLEPMD